MYALLASCAVAPVVALMPPGRVKRSVESRVPAAGSKRCTLTVPELWTRKSICDGVPATSAAAPTPARTTTGFANEGSVRTKLVPRTSHPLSAPVAGVWIAATRLPGTVTGASDAGAVNRVDFSTSSLPPHCLSEPASV